jgi:hypothetical protein
MSRYTKRRYVELLDELVDEKCKCEYCFLKRFLESLHPEPRILFQLKCIEKFKWEKSEAEKRDIGWNEAGMLWANEGWAKAFNKVYDEDLSISEVYELTKKKMGK